ncbi:Hypothetical protein Tpal_656 [Trichococcus palustris]|uniref:G domain-containing protein n=1 Tax=Trichococcus palustris TaxID=140314 RepID=A0A143YCI0_9LACT|nr:hypothetical protein [Trichococcus palustris]CZQ85603.1 Hypothetical protein Tpal_656 [Trichococcus palustris]SFK56385.1 hypothetical protein SAMN04488076_101138 [Trichococcus palustris]
MKKAPAELYKTVINEVTYLIDSLGEPTEEKEILEQQNEAKKKLNGVHKELQTSLEHLAKNAEWDVFTIAFYGETNAGKSTLIETLRILLSEPSKTEERKMFYSSSQAIDQSETILRQFEEDLNQVNISFEKNIVQINEKLETAVSQKTKLIAENKLEHWKVDVLGALIFEKRRSSFCYFIKSFFNRMFEQKEMIKAKERIVLLETETSITNQEIDKIQRELDETNSEWHKKIEMFSPEISKLEEILSNQNDEILKYTDGKIVGDGRSDYTQTVGQYTFRYENQNFVILDLPGIEGREEIVIDEINNAVEKAHAVFYISAKPAPPQNGDEKTEGTIDKIKHHLSQHTEVYFVHNKRIKNPKQLNKTLIGEDDKVALKEVDDVLNKVLSDQYEGHKVLSAYPALLSVGNFWKDKLCKNQEKFIEQLESADNILEDSGVKDFSDWLRTSLVDESKSKIIRSNYRKISFAIGHTQGNISEIQKQFNNLEKKFTLNEKYTNRKLDAESEMLIQNLNNEEIKVIGKFKNRLRKQMYKEIEKEIDKDVFKVTFEKQINIAIDETKHLLEEGMKGVSKEFEKEIKEIVNKEERYTAELLQSFDDSAKFDFEFEPILNIKNSGSIARTISSLGFGVWGIIISSGPLITALAVVSMIISVGKNILGFFNHEYRASQQKKATDENIEKMAIQLSESIRENIKKAHDPLMEGIEKVKGNLSFKIKYVNNMNQVFQEAERKLKLLSWEIEQEGMGKPNGNN